MTKVSEKTTNNNKIDLASVFVILMFLIVFSYLHISTKAFTVATFRCWIIYVLFLFSSLITLIFIYKKKRGVLIAVLLPSIFFIISLGLISIDEKRVIVITLARQIQAECNEQDKCPSSLPGWTKHDDFHYQRQSLHYNPPGTFEHDPAAFRLYYHIWPDFDVFAWGGKGRELTVYVGYE